jgi:hypothetical protein
VLADDLNLLLGDLCTKWGFCNHLSGEQLVGEHDSLTAEAFADAVLLAEGLSPLTAVGHRRNLRRLFVTRYGAASISAAHYLSR